MKPIFFTLLLSLFSMGICQAQLTFLHQDFTTCQTSLPALWQKFSVSGTESWNCATGGFQADGVAMSGYSSGTNHTNEDWLISPLVNAMSYAQPIFYFQSKSKYDGLPLGIYISSNYSGSGNPNLATWSSLTTNMPAVNSDSWTSVNPIDLTAFKNQNFYIAFKYSSTNAAATTWTLDDIILTEGAFQTSRSFINIGQTNVGNHSSADSFHVFMDGIQTQLKVVAESPFELSTDSINYASNLSFTSSQNGSNQTIWVRISPTVADKVFRKKIAFEQNGNPLPSSIELLGTSLPESSTLRVFTWNMRWFGDASNCSCDTALSFQHAVSVLSNAKADVYCLQEVVDASKIHQLAARLGSGFKAVVSPFGSLAADTNSGYYDGCQKLAYIYNSNKIQNLGTFGLLASTYPNQTGSGSPYYCFSSGRYPFIMTLEWPLSGGQTDTLHISNIHAKALSSYTDYSRRECASDIMTDSLLALYGGKRTLVIGDYNDYLEGSFVNGQTQTPYHSLLSHGFTGITLPSIFAGQTTYMGSSDHLIDNVVLSNDLKATYPDSSTFIFTEATRFVTNYENTSSDHIPVMTYLRKQLSTGVWDKVNESQPFNVLNPSQGSLAITTSYKGDYSVNLYTADGNLIFKEDQAKHQGDFRVDLSSLPNGIYFVEVIANKQRRMLKWLRFN